MGVVVSMEILKTILWRAWHAGGEGYASELHILLHVCYIDMFAYFRGISKGLCLNPLLELIRYFFSSSLLHQLHTLLSICVLCYAFIWFSSWLIAFITHDFTLYSCYWRNPRWPCPTPPFFAALSTQWATELLFKKKIAINMFSSTIYTRFLIFAVFSFIIFLQPDIIHLLSPMPSSSNLRAVRWRLMLDLVLIKKHGLEIKMKIWSRFLSHGKIYDNLKK